MPRHSIDPLASAIGSVVREVRTAAGLTQGQLAERMGTNQANVCLWEKGRRGMPMTRLPALAAALGVSVGVLSHRMAAVIEERGALKRA
jgi:transcriptional regulator with XRE-family HTH domain